MIKEDGSKKVVRAERKDWRKDQTKRRMENYQKTGQLRNGAWFCKGGKPITRARVHKYEKMCHYMVRKFLPANALYEASMTYEDLVNQCRLEVFLALVDGFDPVKAMTSKIEDEELRLESVRKKFANIEKTLEKAEISMVYGRIQNYLRRTRWKFHPDQFGGRSESLDEMMGEPDRYYGGGRSQELSTFVHGCYQVQPDRSVLLIKEGILSIAQERGIKYAKRVFDRMARKDPELADALVDNLRQM